MKRHITLGASLTLLLSFSSCKKTKEPEYAPAHPPTTQAPKHDTSVVIYFRSECYPCNYNVDLSIEVDGPSWAFSVSVPTKHKEPSTNNSCEYDGASISVPFYAARNNTLTLRTRDNLLGGQYGKAIFIYNFRSKVNSVKVDTTINMSAGICNKDTLWFRP